MNALETTTLSVGSIELPNDTSKTNNEHDFRRQIRKFIVY